MGASYAAIHSTVMGSGSSSGQLAGGEGRDGAALSLRHATGRHTCNSAFASPRTGPGQKAPVMAQAGQPPRPFRGCHVNVNGLAASSKRREFFADLQRQR